MTAPLVETLPPHPNIAVEHAGDGPLLLFIHGIGGNRSNWRDQLATFAGGFTAAALDLRGYGDSEDYAGPLNFEGFAEDVLRVVDRFGARRAHLVGLSMGGLVAQLFYARHPERVASLTLVASRPASQPNFPEEAGATFLDARLAPLRAGKEPRDIAPAIARSLVAPGAAPAVVDRLIASASALHKDSYMKTLEARTALAPFLDLAAIRVPALVVAGGEDRLAPPAQMRAIADAISGARYVEIAGAGHLVNIEAPAAFDAALRNFYQSIGALDAPELVTEG